MPFKRSCKPGWNLKTMSAATDKDLEASETRQAVDSPRHCVNLRFGRSLSPDAAEQMALNTLRPLIDEQMREAAVWDNAEAGSAMPDGSIAAGIAEDGLQLFTLTQDAPALLNYEDAAKYVQKLNEEKWLGHDDWRIPTRGELHAVFNNRAKIPGLTQVSSTSCAHWYWSSNFTPGDETGGWVQNFENGHQQPGHRVTSKLSVRAIRSRCLPQERSGP